MNERIIKLGVESGMLNYVEHETPRHYFLCGNADEECLEKFAELIVTHCASLCMAKADRKNILNAYNLLTEGDVKYPAPEQQGHHSQYGREYNIPKEKP